MLVFRRRLRRVRRVWILHFQIIVHFAEGTTGVAVPEVVVGPPGLDGRRAQSAVAYSGVSVPQCVRQCEGHCSIEKGTRDADRHGMDLVGRSNKFRKSREGKTAYPKDRRSGR